jgi:predicted  nucleic acid-binding Zn-ribbon protein
VAADQHRIINQLQKKLMDAKTTEEKELVIEELQQQLQRQTRFVQESETCVQLLEEELNKAQDELNVKEKMLKETSTLGEENQIIKSTLQSFTLESKDMMHNINELEKENIDLKKNIEVTLTKAPVAEPADTASEIVAIQSEFMDLKKQYAELEEKYLELKLG